MLRPLEPSVLDQLFVQLCTSRHRGKWWTPDDSGPAAPIGRMMSDLIDLRDKLLGARGDRVAVLRQAVELLPPLKDQVGHKRLADQDGLDEKRMKEFLSGGAGQQSLYYYRSPELVSCLLRGTPDAYGNDRTAIERFFFPREFEKLDKEGKHPYQQARSDRWFFNPSLREPAPFSPQTTAEAVAEAQRLCLLQKYSGQARFFGRIIRVSGNLRYLVVDGNKLTASGRATADCLEQGIECIFVYPKDRATIAQRSYEDFVEVLKRERPDAGKSAHLIPIPLESSVTTLHGRDTWSTMYFSCTLRAVLFSAVPASEPKTQTHEYHSLMFTHRSEQCLSAHDVSDEELCAFLQWFNHWIEPEVAKFKQSRC